MLTCWELPLVVYLVSDSSWRSSQFHGNRILVWFWHCTMSLVIGRLVDNLTVHDLSKRTAVCCRSELKHRWGVSFTLMSHDLTSSRTFYFQTPFPFPSSRCFVTGLNSLPEVLDYKCNPAKFVCECKCVCVCMCVCECVILKEGGKDHLFFLKCYFLRAGNL